MHLHSVPSELLLSASLDGVDTRYGQLYYKINDAAFKSARIDGFLPHNPCKDTKELAVTLLTGTAHAPFPYVPSLVELNTKMILKWNPDIPNAEMPDWSEEEIEVAMLPDNNEDFVDELFLSIPSMPVASTKPTSRMPPTIIELHALLMQSKDSLFFIANNIPSTSVSKWQLVQVAYDNSMAIQPNCVFGGRFLVNFYIQHPDNSRYNAVNQRH